MPPTRTSSSCSSPTRSTSIARSPAPRVRPSPTSTACSSPNSRPRNGPRSTRSSANRRKRSSPSSGPTPDPPSPTLNSQHRTPATKTSSIAAAPRIPLFSLARAKKTRTLHSILRHRTCLLVDISSSDDDDFQACGRRTSVFFFFFFLCFFHSISVIPRRSSTHLLPLPSAARPIAVLQSGSAPVRSSPPHVASTHHVPRSLSPFSSL
mmetsp:Transcript_6016/g.15664  ORF Transcript_6016/g.15664 Transcript_6016/m.15664 type:complete len:208 (-) Transcript_6016:17-640(-)